MSRRKALSLALLLISTVSSVLILVGKEAQQLELPKPPVLGVQTNRESVRVERIIDGDTIKLVDGRTVRYIGIDTPETRHPTKGVECFGKEASQHNRGLVEGQLVELEKDVSETDRYGRQLRYVWLKGQMINQQLVAEGYAHASSYLPDVKYQALLDEAERQATAGQKGLWQSCREL